MKLPLIDIVGHSGEAVGCALKAVGDVRSFLKVFLQHSGPPLVVEVAEGSTDCSVVHVVLKRLPGGRGLRSRRGGKHEGAEEEATPS